MIGLDFKNKMRPLNFNKIEKDGSSQPINPRLLRKFIISDKNKFIALSNQTSPEDILPVRKMLSSFQYDSEQII